MNATNQTLTSRYPYKAALLVSTNGGFEKLPLFPSIAIKQA
ncbi:MULTISPECIES: hypothetical protein [unclassified Methylophaga]|nr:MULTISPECIES: hypothetical protein [unclassified Methylophaga]